MVRAVHEAFHRQAHELLRGGWLDVGGAEVIGPAVLTVRLVSHRKGSRGIRRDRKERLVESLVGIFSQPLLGVKGDHTGRPAVGESRARAAPAPAPRSVETSAAAENG